MKVFEPCALRRPPPPLPGVGVFLAFAACACGGAGTMADGPGDLGGPFEDAGSQADASSDAGFDAGPDAGPDGGPDASQDAALDAGDGAHELRCDATLRVEADDDEGYGFPVLAVLPDGRAAATYRRISGTPRWVGTSRFDPATGAWRELPVDRPGNVNRTAVARQDDDVWAFWFEARGGGVFVFVDRRFDDDTGTWATPSERPGSVAAEPIVATGPGGHAVQLVQRSTFAIDARRLPLGDAAFTPPFVLQDGPARPNNALVRVDGAGRVLVLWQRNFGDRWDFALQRFDGTRWLVDGDGASLPTSFAFDGTGLSRLAIDMAVGSADEAIILHQTADAGAARLAARRVDLTGAVPVVGPAETLVPDGTAVPPFRAALTAGGEALVVWRDFGGGTGPNRLRWSLRRAGAWGAEAGDAEALDVNSFDVVASPAGGFVLAAATGDRLVLRRVGVDGTVGAWVDVGSAATNATGVSMATDASDVHAIFSQFELDAARSSIFHVRCR